MPGCAVDPDPCGTSHEYDPQTDEERANCQVVKDFLARVWYYKWTKEDDQKFLAECESGNNSYVPPAIAAALAELRSAETVRHRRDRTRKPIRSSGEHDYSTCVNSVHAIAQELKVTILDMVAKGDHVVAHMALEGVDRRVDGREDRRGAFNAAWPTGMAFRHHATALYRVHEGKIAEDWLLYGGDLVYRTLPDPY